MLGLIVLGVSVTAFVGVGFWLERTGFMPRRPKAALALALVFSFLTIVFFAASAFAAQGPEGATGSGNAGLSNIAAALATGLACIGAGIGVGFVGAAALGVVGEKPEFLGKTLIYVGLAEGIAIYGIIISILIMFG